MPLLERAAVGIQRAGEASMGRFALSQAALAQPLSLHVRRAVATTLSPAALPPATSSSATPAAGGLAAGPSPPAGELPAPGAAASSAPGLGGVNAEIKEVDLERLADQVYAIIERRLILERESRGL
jgi:hypothetical protein